MNKNEKVLLILVVALCLFGCATQTQTVTSTIEVVDEPENNEIVNEYFKDGVKVPMFVDSSFLDGYYGKKME